MAKSKTPSANVCSPERNPADEPKVLTLLHEAQARDGFVTQEAIARIAERTGFTESEIAGVASFYAMFYLKPKGRFVVRVCASPSCVVNGGNRLLDWARELLGVEKGGTTADGAFTLEAVSCFGRCDTAPNVMVDEENFGNVDSKDKLAKIIDSFKAKKKQR